MNTNLYALEAVLSTICFFSSKLRRDALSEIGPEQTKEKSRVHTESSAATASSSTTITTIDALATNVEATENYPVMDSEVPVTTTCSILGMVESTSTSPIAAMSVDTGACNSSRSLSPKSQSCEKCKRLVWTNRRLKRKIKTLKQNVKELKSVSDA